MFDKLPKICSDIMFEIFKTLNFKDIVKFESVSKIFTKFLKENDKFWGAMYLKEFENSKITFPEIKRYEFIKKQYPQFVERQKIQNEQIDFLTTAYSNTLSSGQNSPFKELLISLKLHSLEEFSFSLLEQNQEILEKIDEYLIRKEIVIGYDVLNLRSLGITSIPESVLGDITLKEYWNDLKRLYLSNNALITLPETILNFNSLEELECIGNWITILPDALVKLANLKYIGLDRNRLTRLPNLNELNQLTVLSCMENKIEELPHDLGLAPCLESLSCNYNNLTVLPKSLETCKSLKVINCSYNKITEISPVLLQGRVVLLWGNPMINGSKHPSFDAIKNSVIVPIQIDPEIQVFFSHKTQKNDNVCLVESMETNTIVENDGDFEDTVDVIMNDSYLTDSESTDEAPSSKRMRY